MTLRNQTRKYQLINILQRMRICCNLRKTSRNYEGLKCFDRILNLGQGYFLFVIVSHLVVRPQCFVLLLCFTELWSRKQFCCLEFTNLSEGTCSSTLWQGAGYFRWVWEMGYLSNRAGNANPIPARGWYRKNSPLQVQMKNVPMNSCSDRRDKTCSGHLPFPLKLYKTINLMCLSHSSPESEWNHSSLSMALKMSLSHAVFAPIYKWFGKLWVSREGSLL